MDFEQYKIITTDELIEMIKSWEWERDVSALHIHHTWSPDHSDFIVDNYYKIQKAMRDYHVNENGWSDIAQNLTLFPDGKWGLGRNFNKTPASILGWNTGSFCIEMIGNFDINFESLKDEQQDAIYKFSEFCIEQLGWVMKFHRDSPTSYKTCPGSGIDRDEFFNNVLNYTENKIRQERENLEQEERIKAQKEADERLERIKLIMEKTRIIFEDMINNSGEVHWSNDYVNALYDKNIIKGKKLPDGKLIFDPDGNITRGEMATLLNKAIESIQEWAKSEFK